jgi:predicted nucleic acid-binding protein
MWSFGQVRATALISGSRFALSTQVMQEFISNALRKPSLGIPEEGIDAFLELCGNVTVLPVTRELLLRATSIRRRYRVSHWDSTILAAAQELRCRTLHSEDLSHGQNFDGVRVVDPFR